MVRPTVVEQLVEKFRDDPDYVAEQMVLAFGESMVECMSQRQFNRAELANRMGVSKAYITRILNGKPNMTIRTMAGIAVALKAKLDVTMECPTHDWRWITQSGGTQESWRVIEHDGSPQRPYEETEALALAA